MSLRRLLPALCLGILVLALIGACFPWSVASVRLTRAVGTSLTTQYGIAMKADGPAGIALLPLPRLDFEGVRLNAGTVDGPLLAEGGTLILKLGIRALLAGRIEVDTLSLERTTITLPVDDADRRWAEPVRRLKAHLTEDGGSRPRRISLTDATIVGRDPRDGSAQTASDVDLILSWPFWSSQTNVAGSFLWNDTPTQFSLSGLRLDELFSGRESPFSASVTWPAGHLSAEGRGIYAGGVSLRGQGSLQTRSLRETMDWAGTDVALAPFLETFAIDGTFESSGRNLLLPSMRLQLGDNRLEGAGSISFGENRPALQATLAAENLNLAPVLATLIRVFGPDDTLNANGWSRQSLALRPFTGGDLDLRLSAGSARLGPVVMEDVASSLLVREGSVEGSLSRASLRGGTIKGRFGLTTSASDRGETELRAQGAFDQLDLGTLLVDIGQEGWILGNAQGQFMLEGAGRTAAGLIGHLNGRSSFAMEGGTLTGLDLADVVHRNGVAADGALARRNGRTPFERAGVTLRFVDGVGDITDGMLKTASLTASLRGTLSLPERSLVARAELMPRAAGDTTLRPGASQGPPQGSLFDIEGPWDAVAVRALSREGGSDLDSRGGSIVAPNALRVPATGTFDLPMRVRAYAP
ncbi:AsmA family protein [Methylobacterium sp. 77]|uniref:AsmA family protein n=1 Tax=Methylobacterium sp. 77 TaxID=1101192 RepID=UPI00036F7C76|nr:AsmA family protein [Methylobacterium sp. 77]